MVSSLCQSRFISCPWLVLLAVWPQATCLQVSTPGTGMPICYSSSRCESPSFLLALAPDTWQGWCFLILTLLFSGLPLPHTSFITFSRRTQASFLPPHKHRRCFSGPTAQAGQQLCSWKYLLLQHEKPTSDPQPLVRAQGHGQR